MIVHTLTEYPEGKEKPEIKITNLEGLPLVPPTRLEFELGNLRKAVFYKTDGRKITYEVVEE